MKRNLELSPERDRGARSAHSATASDNTERGADDAAPLPTSLGEAVDALERTTAAREWFTPAHLDAYLRAKRAEAANANGVDPEVLCARYAEAY